MTIPLRDGLHVHAGVVEAIEDIQVISTLVAAGQADPAGLLTVDATPTIDNTNAGTVATDATTELTAHAVEINKIKAVLILAGLATDEDA